MRRISYQLTDIIMKPADKGSATVIMDRDAYIAEADKQLNNIRHYNRLDQDLNFNDA